MFEETKNKQIIIMIIIIIVERYKYIEKMEHFLTPSGPQKQPQMATIDYV